jgi:hypothetical protein
MASPLELFESLSKIILESIATVRTESVERKDPIFSTDDASKRHPIHADSSQDAKVALRRIVAASRMLIACADPNAMLFEKAMDCHTTSALNVVVRLGIAKTLGEEEMPIDELTKTTNVNGSKLTSILRHLANNFVRLSRGSF